MSEFEPADLESFGGIARLFPLPGVVLFPNAVLPLHIFEPRYRVLVEDAIDSDRLITLVQPQRGESARPGPEYDLEAMGCIGQIIGHEKLADGRCNLLLLGLRRCRLRRELPRTRLYRQAEVTLVDDLDIPTTGLVERHRLVEGFRQVVGQVDDPDLESILVSDISVGALTDIMAHALGISAEAKQLLLNEKSVARRVNALLQLMGVATTADRGEDNPWEPPSPFCPN